MTQKLVQFEHAFQSAAVADGNGTAMDTGGLPGVYVQVEGITSATVNFEGTIDGSTWYAILALNMTSGAVAATTTADGLFWIPGGVEQLRCRISSYATGTITASGRGVVNAMIPVSIVLAANSGVDIGDVDVTSLPTSIQGPGNPEIDSYTSAVVNTAAAADQPLVAAPGANKQIWVYGLHLMANTGAGTVTLQDEDNTALTGTMAVSDEGGWVLPLSGNFAMPWFVVPTNKALELDAVTCTVGGIIVYAVVSV